MFNQTTVMSFFEQYNMGMPLIVTSLNLLAKLRMQYHAVQDRTYHQSKLRGSGIPIQPTYNGSARIRISTNTSNNNSAAFGTQSQTSINDIILDPNNDFDEHAIHYWLSLCDFYTLPHVVLFDSVEHLVDIFEKMWREPARLHAIHNAMRATNSERIKSLLHYWRRRLLDIAEFSPHKPE